MGPWKVKRIHSSEENDFSLVENQVRSRLEESGMEADDENMAAAKWLYEEDLPVTAENVALSSQVKELKETKDSVFGGTNCRPDGGR